MANIELDGANKKIKVDSGDLTLDVPGDIILDADGADLVFADGGTNILKVSNSSSDVVLQPQVDAKDIIFKQYDGTTVATVEDNGTFNIPTDKLAINGTAVTSTAAELNIMDGVTSTTAELNILDGVTATAAEINLIDGGTARGTTAIADGDGVLINDAGTMRQTTVETLKTYMGGGTNTPYFSASVTSNQTLTHDTNTLINFDRADVDSASGYDTSNKRYTIPSGQGGYWHIGYTVNIGSGSSDKMRSGYIYPKKNGSDFPSFNSRHQGVASTRQDGNPLRNLTLEKSFIATYSAGDHITINCTLGHTDGGSNTGQLGEYYSNFWGYRLVQ